MSNKDKKIRLMLHEFCCKGKSRKGEVGTMEEKEGESVGGAN